LLRSPLYLFRSLLSVIERDSAMIYIQFSPVPTLRPCTFQYKAGMMLHNKQQPEEKIL
jgi:hypothetical protein